MPISKPAKEDILDKLTESHRKGQKLAVRLVIGKKNAEAAAVKAANRKLQKQIDRLLTKLMKDWTGSAPSVIAKIGGINAKLQGVIRDIKKKIEVAQKVVRAIGLIDDAVSLAKDLAV